MCQPKWNLPEFKTLMISFGWSDEELAKRLEAVRRLPTPRSHGAIEAVKKAVHAYHFDEADKFAKSALNLIMKDYLKKNKGSLICPKCGIKF